MPQYKHIPQLRFPGFEGEWEKKRLDSLLEFKNGINASKEQYGRGYKFINVLDILENDFITHNKIIGSVNVDAETANKYVVSYGDILFQRSSETREEVGTASVYLDKEKIATFGGFVIRGKKIGEYEPVFLNRLLKTDIAREQITSKSGGSTRYNVGQEILASIVLPFPSLPEQQKIASFFTAIDKKIALLKQQKEKLLQYKQGVMQQIFSRQLRFKTDEGKDFPDWVEKKLGEVTFKVDRKNKNKEMLPVYSISNKNGFVPQSEQFDGIDSNDRGYDISLYKIVERNTFAYNPARINVGSIGYSGDLEKVIVSSLYVTFKTNELIDDSFFNHFLKTDFFNTSVLRMGEGGVRVYLFYENFSEITINIPSLSEQTKIANFLSAIDEKINRVQAQTDAATQWKKGLLQKMFV